jgi:integrase
MVRQTNRLAAVGLAAKAPGFYPDGRGLYFSVSPAGSRSWIYRFMLRGRSRDMGLGAFPDVSLADARIKATAARSLCRDGIDPIERRDETRKSKAIEKSRSISFEKCTALYFEANKAAWRNERHAHDWDFSFRNHVFPQIGQLPVRDVDTAAILKVLEPIWLTRSVTAGRIRGRIEAVLAYATVRQFREGANPAQWKHHLSHLLPKPGKLRTVQHHPALPYDQTATFLVDVRAQPGAPASALEFLILAASRTAEVLDGKLCEIDFDKALWTIPASRMKMRVEHRVPLSPAALAIARNAGAADREYIFENEFGSRLEKGIFFELLRSMNRDDLTTHGFRSTFRDWAAACTDHPNHVVEMALAHTVGKVEGAYRRDPMIEKRRLLMNDWADYATRQPTTATVIRLQAVG